MKPGFAFAAISVGAPEYGGLEITHPQSRQVQAAESPATVSFTAVWVKT
jgi:hypothetical protein